MCGEEVACMNGFDGDGRNIDPCIYSQRWKPAAAIWHGHGQQSYRMPVNHPSPDAGYSVDVLYPILKYTPIFRYTKEEGFIFTGRNERNEQKTRISLPIRRRHGRRLHDTAGSTEQTPLRHSDDHGPAFPSRNAVRGNVLRTAEPFGDTGCHSDIELWGTFLTASYFTIKAINTTTNGAWASQGSNSMDYIYQEREEQAMDQDRDENGGEPPATGPVLLGNPGGNQLFRAFLEGIGAMLPPTMQDTIFGQQGSDEEDEQEVFYPIKGPSHALSPALSVMEDQPYRAIDLEGIWVGGYSTHGYEFGRMVVRNTWTRIHTADEVALEQIYDDEIVDEGNAEPLLAREPLSTGNLDSALRRRRTIVEFIKITGDVNVPAGQVSWVAVLPSADDQPHQQQLLSQADVLQNYSQASTPEPDLSTMAVPTLRRSDFQAWSNLPPNIARDADLGNHGATPRWEEGSVRAAGRIAFTGFVDTRFIDAQATFIREDAANGGGVEEIRVKW